MRKKVLWVTDEVPDRDCGGGSIRQYHLLRRLAEQADVDLALVGELRDRELRASLHRVVEVPAPPEPPPWRQWLIDRQSVLPGRTPTEIRLSKPKAALLRPHVSDTRAYDVVQIEHSGLATLLPGGRDGLKRVITLHNLISVRMRQLGDVASKGRVRWLLERDAQRASSLEEWIVDHFDMTIVMSDGDAAAVGGRAVVVPNGVDLDRFTPTDLPAAPVLVFTATFSYGPNIDGAVWFCHDVLPRVREAIPDVRVLLVGREPHSEVRALAGAPGVEVHFDVPAVLPYLETARVSLAPLRAGSGTRLKVLEAMSAGRPVAGTPIGVEGLGLQDGESAAIAADATTLADSIIRLCRDDGYARQVAAAARRLAESRFAWDAIADGYVSLVLDTSISPATRQTD